MHIVPRPIATFVGVGSNNPQAFIINPKKPLLQSLSELPLKYFSTGLLL